MRKQVICLAALCACAPSAEGIDNVALQRTEMQMQGTQLQGIQLQGSQAQGMTMQGFRPDGATLNGAALTNLRVQQGELFAEQGGVTLHGADLANAHVLAQVHNVSVNPPVTAVIEYQITAVESEDPIYDLTSTGGTFLYTLLQNVDNTGSWQPACGADTHGRSVALPVAAIWNEHGDRVESSSLFTLGCTTGVIAKCYRWGYRPWITGFGDMVGMHQTCTRLARADYCGNGTTHTRDGTVINEWDKGPAPGPVEPHAATPLGMLFEAGWNKNGAVCLSHTRWLTGGLVIAQACPTRLVSPTLVLLGATVCDTISQVLGQSADANLFNESNLNLNLDLF